MQFLKKFYDYTENRKLDKEQAFLGYNEFLHYFVGKYGFDRLTSDTLIHRYLKALDDDVIFSFIELALKKQKQETEKIVKNTEEKTGRTMWDIYLYILENKKYPSSCTLFWLIILAFIWYIIAYPDIIDVLKNILYCK